MSHNSLWYNDEQLAGPSRKATPLSFNTPSSPYEIGLPCHQESLSQASEYSISHIFEKKPGSRSDIKSTSQCDGLSCFDMPDCGDEAMKEMLQFHDRFRPQIYDEHQHNLTLLAGSSGSSHPEDLDTGLSGMPNPRLAMQNNESHQDDLCAMGSPWYCQQDVTSFISCYSPTPSDSADFPGSPSITPFFKETLDTHLNSDLKVCSQTLSPYSPMPLQPIFQLELQSKPLHDPTDFPPHFQHPHRHTEDTRNCSKDPLLISPSHTGYEEALGSAGIPFTRGAIVSGCLWPPSSLVSLLPISTHQGLCQPIATDIPLEIAKQYAQDCREARPHTQLSQQFLLSFMGQIEGELPWSCYIRDCGKKLNRKSHMVDHIRMHLDERVYACEYCPQMFLRKADCKRHLTAHNPEKAFQCDLCVKSFGRKDLLTRHRRKCESNSNKINQGIDGSTKGLGRKRKRLQGHSILNTQGAQNVFSDAGSLFH